MVEDLRGMWDLDSGCRVSGLCQRDNPKFKLPRSSQVLPPVPTSYPEPIACQSGDSAAPRSLTSSTLVATSDAGGSESLHEGLGQPLSLNPKLKSFSTEAFCKADSENLARRTEKGVQNKNSSLLSQFGDWDEGHSHTIRESPESAVLGPAPKQ